MEKGYLKFIQELKQSIIQSRYQAAKLANREQLLLYYKTGKILSEKVMKEKWGAKVLEQISIDLQKQIPGIRGFSYRNLRNMKQFYEAYANTVIGQMLSGKLPGDKHHSAEIIEAASGYEIIDYQADVIWQTPSAKLVPSLSELINHFFHVSFSHHLLILNRSAKEERLFYISMAATEFWSLTILQHQIQNRLFQKQGKLPNNFSETLPEELKPSAVQLFNDEYLMDYMNLGDADDERDVENKIVANIRDFILRMGKGFSFIGNQFRIELDGEEFFIDLLFYNRILKCLVAFELKRAKFKPEYTGQLNFYLNVLDQHIKLPGENSSIGIILCKERNNTIAEYSVKNISNPIGIATFKTTTEMPRTLQNVLPSEKELLNFL